MNEFYFVRHGQTDVNIGKLLGDHRQVPLNATGRMQIENLRDNFPQIVNFEMVCESPLLRVKQTADILLGKNHPAPRMIVDQLEECSWKVWCQMESVKFHFESHPHQELQTFLEQIDEARQITLSQGKKLLIVAHGGVYNALLHHLGITWDGHIENGELVHFTKEECWKKNSLYIPHPREDEYSAYVPGDELP